MTYRGPTTPSVMSNVSPFADNSDPILANLLSTNQFRRAFWRGINDLVNDNNGPMRNSKVLPVAEANRAALGANGVTYSLTGFISLTNWIDGRKGYLRDQLKPVTAAFVMQDPTGNITTSQPTYTLKGQAPFDSVYIYTNGVDSKVDWTTVTNWQRTVNLGVGANAFTVTGRDRSGNAISGESPPQFTITRQ